MFLQQIKTILSLNRRWFSDKIWKCFSTLSINTAFMHLQPEKQRRASVNVVSVLVLKRWVKYTSKNYFFNRINAYILSLNRRWFSDKIWKCFSTLSINMAFMHLQPEKQRRASVNVVWVLVLKRWVKNKSKK
jgi:hypothetical protein